MFSSTRVKEQNTTGKPSTYLLTFTQISTCMKFLPVATILFYFINFVPVATLKNVYNGGNKISHRCLTVKCKNIRLKILMLTYSLYNMDFIYTSRSTLCKINVRTFLLFKPSMFFGGSKCLRSLYSKFGRKILRVPWQQYYVYCIELQGTCSLVENNGLTVCGFTITI